MVVRLTIIRRFKELECPSYFFCLLRATNDAIFSFNVKYFSFRHIVKENLTRVDRLRARAS